MTIRKWLRCVKKFKRFQGIHGENPFPPLTLINALILPVGNQGYKFLVNTTSKNKVNIFKCI